MGRELGEQSLAFIPAVLSPVSPSLPGLFLHFLCFSCLLGHPGADTHTKSEPRPGLSLCHRRCEPLCSPRGTVVPLIRLAERARGQAGLWACTVPLASSSAQAVAMGLRGGGP